jgi:hypothetical protein
LNVKTYETASSTVLAGGGSGTPLNLYLNSIGSNETRRQYKRKLAMFLESVGIEGSSLEEKSSHFVEEALADNKWAFMTIV